MAVTVAQVSKITLSCSSSCSLFDKSMRCTNVCVINLARLCLFIIVTPVEIRPLQFHIVHKFKYVDVCAGSRTYHSQDHQIN